VEEGVEWFYSGLKDGEDEVIKVTDCGLGFVVMVMRGVNRMNFVGCRPVVVVGVLREVAWLQDFRMIHLLWVNE